MESSLFYFANDSTDAGESGRYELLTEGARFADAHGFAAVWTPERHFHPFGGLYPNPAVTGAALAAITKRIGIRAGSVVAPLHHPLRIAEEWSVVDNLSGGRVGISFASGWHPVDFALDPEAHPVRRERLVSALETVRKLWRGEAMPVVDGAGRDTQVRIFPPPVQRELPCWLTSSGSAGTFRLAGELKAGVLTHLLGQNLGELAAKIAEYRRAAADSHGWAGHVVLMMHTFLGDDADEVRELVREPLRAYLSTSFNLSTGTIARGGVSFDPGSVDSSDLEFLIQRSFERFYENDGIFGTVEQGLRMVERLRAIGVDEVACLIDFGVHTKAVLASLEHLNRLRMLAADTVS